MSRKTFAKKRPFLAWLLVAAGILFAQVSRAHETNDALLNERVTFTPRDEALDITFVWEFHGNLAREQRRSMDTDRSTSVSRREAEHYADTLGASGVSRIAAALDGTSADLISYYDPELDFGGTRAASAPHLTVSLQCFVRWPTRQRPLVAVEIVDSLWPDSPALLETVIDSTNGRIDVIDRALRSVPPNQPRVFRVEAHRVPPSTSSQKTTTAAGLATAPAILVRKEPELPPGPTDGTWRSTVLASAVLLAFCLLLGSVPQRT